MKKKTAAFLWLFLCSGVLYPTAARAAADDPSSLPHGLEADQAVGVESTSLYNRLKKKSWLLCTLGLVCVSGWGYHRWLKSKQTPLKKTDKRFDQGGILLKKGCVLYASALEILFYLIRESATNNSFEKADETLLHQANQLADQGEKHVEKIKTHFKHLTYTTGEGGIDYRINYSQTVTDEGSEDPAVKTLKFFMGVGATTDFLDEAIKFCENAFEKIKETLLGAKERLQANDLLVGFVATQLDLQFDQSFKKKSLKDDENGVLYDYISFSNGISTGLNARQISLLLPADWEETNSYHLKKNEAFIVKIEPVNQNGKFPLGSHYNGAYIYAKGLDSQQELQNYLNFGPEKYTWVSLIQLKSHESNTTLRFNLPFLKQGPALLDITEEFQSLAIVRNEKQYDLDKLQVSLSTKITNEGGLCQSAAYAEMQSRGGMPQKQTEIVYTIKPGARFFFCNGIFSQSEHDETRAFFPFYTLENIAGSRSLLVESSNEKV